MNKLFFIVSFLAVVSLASEDLHALPAGQIQTAAGDTLPSKLKVMRSSYDHQNGIVTIELTLKDQSTGDVYRIEEINNNTKRLYKNDLMLPEDEIAKYKSILQRLEEFKIQRDETANTDVINPQNKAAGKTEKTKAAKKSSVTQPVISGEDKIRSNPEINKILDELIEAGVISNKETVKFKLDYKGLTVNNKQQSESLHQKLRKQYLSKEGDYIELDLRSDSSFVSFNRN